MQIPDISKIAWQLNVAIIGAVFSAISLIYNEKYIYYGFATFLFAVISHFISTWFEFVYNTEQLRNKRKNFYFAQSFLFIVWLGMLALIYSNVSCI